MRSIFLALALFLTASVSGAAQPLPTVDDLLSGLDKNMTFDTRTATMTMTVTKSGRSKSYQIQSYGKGADQAAMEFMSPPRDAGTKMLKKGDDLEMYLPSIEKIQRISGHMLREGMMGSDFSYEDLMESDKLKTLYKGSMQGEETLDGRPCYKVQLDALSQDQTYTKRVIWIDEETLIPAKQELYALSGTLLKVITMSEVKDFSGRKFPTHIVAEDKLQTGSQTVVDFNQLTFSVALPDEVFSERWLER